eukprot:m.23634 g.23634  ORF g.23634 m.23634 type:complete len:538 (-) comp14292_c0_seq1:229-1842(-)
MAWHDIGVGILALIGIALSAEMTSAVLSPVRAANRNVIHVIVDDLRPELGAYGVANRHTPTLDKLAVEGTVFDRAYCQQAVCGPSRNSFLTGRRPDRSRSWNFINHFREDHPDWTTLPGAFLEAGRLALGSGKTFHPKLPPAYDGNRSWSPEALPFYNPCWNTADNTSASFQDGGLPCVFCPIDIAGKLDKKINVSIANEFCEIDAFEDSFSVDFAIQLLSKAADRPFYLAVGFHKPHMPWQAAPEDFAKHPLASITLPKQKLPPSNVPGIALHFTDSPVHSNPWEAASDVDLRNARRGYLAAVTGMDRKLGKLVEAVESLGLTNSTAFVVHGDHGWHLGELGQFRKMTNFELATRVPLIMKIPWLKTVSRVSGLVELVDVFPTIIALAQISLPSNQKLDGISLLPFIVQNETNVAPNSTVIKNAAFSQYPRLIHDASEPWKSDIIHHNRTNFTHMGLSVRTSDFRYTEWLLWNKTSLRPIWGDVFAKEFYDHRNETMFPTDFDDASENQNLASNVLFNSTITSLSELLFRQFSADW